MGHIINTLFGPEEVDEGFKECIKCEEVLPLSEFGNSNGGNYPRTECKKCNNKLTKERERYRTIPVPDDYKCPICLGTEEDCRGLGGKNSGTWCVDHDHKTNEFRGWLCHACNRTIGNFHEDIEKLKRAIEYLEGKRRPIIIDGSGFERFAV